MSHLSQHLSMPRCHCRRKLSKVGHHATNSLGGKGGCVVQAERQTVASFGGKEAEGVIC
jgi:hypothetical protein